MSNDAEATAVSWRHHGNVQTCSSHFISLTIRRLSHTYSLQQFLILRAHRWASYPWLRCGQCALKPSCCFLSFIKKPFCSKCWGAIVSSLSFQPNNADGVHICNPASLSGDFNGWLTCSFISWLNLTEGRLAKTDEVFRRWSVLFSGSMTAGRNCSWTCKVYIFRVKCPLKHWKLFWFPLFQTAGSLVTCWSQLIQSSERVKTSPQKPPAAWSTFLCLLNRLFCSFDSCGATSVST